MKTTIFCALLLAACAHRVPSISNEAAWRIQMVKFRVDVAEANLRECIAHHGECADEYGRYLKAIEAAR